MSFVEKAAIILRPTPNRPRCCFSTYLPDVRNEQTATGTLSDGTPMPLSSQVIVHRSFAESSILSESDNQGNMCSISQESSEFSISSRTAIYRMRSVVKPASAELSTKNSDSAFLSYLTLSFVVVLACAAATSIVAFCFNNVGTIPLTPFNFLLYFF